MRRTLIAAATALAVVLGGAGAAGAQETSDKTIVEIAQSNPDLSTLVKAVSAAGLAETLSGPGPFTVFAPTNAAFEALPPGTLDKLLADPTGQLASILKLHVVSGEISSQAAVKAVGGTVETLGGPVSVTSSGDKLMIGGATIVQTDIKASNGVIHVIDSVITKPATSASTAMPNAVNTGNSGIAAGESGTGILAQLLLGMLAVAAVSGIGISSVSLARNRRKA